MRILIAEDDMDLARLAETVLRANGHEVLKAVDASQVLPKARSNKPDMMSWSNVWGGADWLYLGSGEWYLLLF